MNRMSSGRFLAVPPVRRLKGDCCVLAKRGEEGKSNFAASFGDGPRMARSEDCHSCAVARTPHPRRSTVCILATERPRFPRTPAGPVAMTLQALLTVPDNVNDAAGVIAALDRCFLVGFGRLGPEQHPALQSLRRIFSETPLEASLGAAVDPLGRSEF